MEGSIRPDAQPDVVAWGDSPMGRLIAGHDWSQSRLGDPESWPISLKTVLRIVLGSQRAQAIWWGSDHAQFFNDRFRDQFGALRSLEITGPAAANWADVWEAAADRIAAALAGDEGWTAPIAIAGVVGKEGPGADAAGARRRRRQAGGFSLRVDCLADDREVSRRRAGTGGARAAVPARRRGGGRLYLGLGSEDRPSGAQRGRRDAVRLSTGRDRRRPGVGRQQDPSERSRRRHEATPHGHRWR